MKFEKFDTETVSELLKHLADHESFDSVKGIRNISSNDVKTLFLEIAELIQSQQQKQANIKRVPLKTDGFSDQTSKVLQNLSANEEDVLFKSFKIA